MGDSSERPAYTIDASSLNRYLWYSISDGKIISEDRRRRIIAETGESIVKACCLKLEELVLSGRVISHVEVRHELRDAGNSVWNRWLIQQQQRRLFKGVATSPSSFLNEMAIKHSAFLAKAKPGRRRHADPWLLAQAKNAGLILITEDGPLRELAMLYDIKTISLFDLIRTEAAIKPDLFSSALVPLDS